MFQKLDLLPSLGEWGGHVLCWIPFKELTSVQ
jgi:hypothetical protein